MASAFRRGPTWGLPVRIIMDWQELRRDQSLRPAFRVAGIICLFAMAPFEAVLASETKQQDQMASSYLDVASQEPVFFPEAPYNPEPPAIPSSELDTNGARLQEEMAPKGAVYREQGAGVNMTKKFAMLGGFAMCIALLLGATLVVQGKLAKIFSRSSEEDISWEEKAKELQRKLSVSQKQAEAVGLLASKLEREVHQLQTSEQEHNLREEWLSMQETAYGLHLHAMLHASLQKHEAIFEFLHARDFSDLAIMEFKQQLEEIDIGFLEGIPERNSIQHGFPPGGVFIPPADYPTLRKKQWQADVRRARAITLLRGIRTAPFLWDDGEEEGDDSHDIRNELAMAARGARNQLNAHEELFDVHRAAVSRLSGTFPDVLPRIFTVNQFTAMGGSQQVFENVRFQLGRVLLADPTGVMFEAVLLDPKVEKAIGSNKLAVKLFIRRIFGNDDSSLPKNAAEREHAVAEQIMQYTCSASKTVLSMAEVGQLSGIHLPLYQGTLEPVPVDKQQADDFMHSPDVSFYAPIASSAMHAVDFLSSEDTELSTEARLFLARKLLKISTGLNVAGLCHNDHHLNNLLLLEDGTPVLGSLAAASEPGVPLWIPAMEDLPSEEQVGAGKVDHPLASEEGDAWTAGRVAYNILTSELPYRRNWDASDLPLKDFRQSSGSRRASPRSILRRSNQLPAFRLRQHHVPEPWVQLLSTVLMRDFKSRPSLRQVVEAFPNIFGNDGLNDDKNRHHD